MPSNFYDCTPASSDPLYRMYEHVRDYMLELLSWLRNILNDLWDYLAQVSSSISSSYILLNLTTQEHMP